MNETMEAVRLHAAREPLQLERADVPIPTTGEVLIQVRAAGVCRSDLHYRQGAIAPEGLPRTLGHEIAGVVARTGAGVTGVSVGDRVAVHYVVACGECASCRRHGEQFCERGAMIGKDRDGGFADYVLVPERNAVRMPDGVAFEDAAVMMCSSATALHALNVAQIAADDRVCIVGLGGLGMSALLIARALGLPAPMVVEQRADKIAAAGATAYDDGPVDVVIDFVGNPELTSRMLQRLAPRGRLVLVALSRQPFAFDPYRDVLCGERRIIGCSDHTREEVEQLLALNASGALDLGSAITRRLPLDAGSVNATIDDLAAGTSHFRTVLVR